MPDFHGRIVDEINCRNCNAPAKVKTEERPKSNTLIMYVTCDKCKKRDYYGLTTKTAVGLRQKRLKIEKALEKETNEASVKKLRRYLMCIDKDIHLAEVGL